MTTAPGAGPLAAALADRYRIERELGQGGMATVYLAEDLKHRRRVAVKVLRPDLAQSLGAGRFLREIEIAAKLSHPHILPLHDSGDAGGFLFYVMPFVEGESLRQRLTREGALPPADAARFLREIADALAHAHSHGVVHRDIKPENVMLSGRHALVMDFGVAKAVREADPEGTPLHAAACGRMAAPARRAADLGRTERPSEAARRSWAASQPADSRRVFRQSLGPRKGVDPKGRLRVQPSDWARRRLWEGIP